MDAVYANLESKGCDGSMEKVHRYIDEAFDRYLVKIKALLRQPSVSATGEGVRECASLLARMMEESGIRTEIFETAGNPIVFGEIPAKKGKGNTVLFYGHYDVQPPDPVNLWDSPPFEPTVRDGRLFARGVSDNKGQLLAHVLAADAFRAAGMEIPCSVKFVFEGEEESGSTNLPSFVKSHADLLACQIVLPVDGSVLFGDVPNVRLGCRGVVNFEIELETADFDCHSGRGGGILPNAGWELVNLLRTMKDERGNILIEGFMDEVRTPSDYDRKVIDGLPFDSEKLKKLYGVSSLDMTKFEYYRRLNLAPTLSINGITCGYQGAGSKTVNPSKASVKMDARIVVDQDPEDIIGKIRKHVARHAPNARFRVHGYMHPSKTDGNLPLCRAVLESLRKVYSGVALALGSGGSLPNHVWTGILGVPALGIPYANEDSNNHAPNENVKLELLKKGIHASAQIMADLG